MASEARLACLRPRADGLRRPWTGPFRCGLRSGATRTSTRSRPLSRGADKKDPHHVSCAPRVDESRLIWDGADNMVFRPLSETLGVVTSGESVNVNSLDEVPDSAWFTNRIGMHPMSLAQLELGACKPSELLDGDQRDRRHLGHRPRQDGRLDRRLPREHPRQGQVPLQGRRRRHAGALERGADHRRQGALRGGLLHLVRAGRRLPAARRSSSCPVCTGSTTSATRCPSTRRPSTRCSRTRRSDGTLVRMQASALAARVQPRRLPLRGHARRRPERRHPARGPARAARATAPRGVARAHDERAGNTVDMWIADNPAVARLVPGHVIHYQLDTSESLGSTLGMGPDLASASATRTCSTGATSRATSSRSARASARGTPSRRTPGEEFFGYFNVERLRPRGVEERVPGRGVQPDDRARRRVDGADPRALHAGDGRRARAVGTAHGPAQDRLPAARARGAAREDPRALPHAPVAHRGRARRGRERRSAASTSRSGEGCATRARSGTRRGCVGGGWLPVERRAGGAGLRDLPHVAEDGGAADADPGRYVRVRLEDGVATGPLVAHLYDLGPARGYVLAGLERVENEDGTPLRRSTRRRACRPARFRRAAPAHHHRAHGARGRARRAAARRPWSPRARARVHHHRSVHVAGGLAGRARERTLRRPARRWERTIAMAAVLPVSLFVVPREPCIGHGDLRREWSHRLDRGAAVLDAGRQGTDRRAGPPALRSHRRRGGARRRARLGPGGNGPARAARSSAAARVGHGLRDRRRGPAPRRRPGAERARGGAGVR